MMVIVCVALLKDWNFPSLKLWGPSEHPKPFQVEGYVQSNVAPKAPYYVTDMEWTAFGHVPAQRSMMLNRMQIIQIYSEIARLMGPDEVKIFFLLLCTDGRSGMHLRIPDEPKYAGIKRDVKLLLRRMWSNNNFWTITLKVHTISFILRESLTPQIRASWELRQLFFGISFEQLRIDQLLMLHSNYEGALNIDNKFKIEYWRLRQSRGACTMTFSNQSCGEHLALRDVDERDLKEMLVTHH